MRIAFLGVQQPSESAITATMVTTAIGAGAGAASNIYASHRAGSTNDKAIKAQQESDRIAAQQAAANRESAAALYREQLASYERANAAVWGTAGKAMNGLRSIAGLGDGGGGGPIQPPAGGPPTSQPGPVGAQPMPQGGGGMMRRPMPMVAQPRGGMSLANIMQMVQQQATQRGPGVPGAPGRGGYAAPEGQLTPGEEMSRRSGF